jgi:hypothetical protein
MLSDCYWTRDFSTSGNSINACSWRNYRVPLTSAIGGTPPVYRNNGEGALRVDSGPSNHGSKAASLHDWRSFFVSGFVGCRFILS